MDGAGDDVVDADFQAATVDEAFDNGGEFAGIFFAVVSGTGESQIGPAADDLGPGAVGRRGVVAVVVLMFFSKALTASWVILPFSTSLP